MSGRRVLITGVSTRLGTELARRLERDPSVEYIAGLDVRPPRARLERTEFIDADIRNPVIGKLIPQTQVDTVVHNQIVRQPGGGVAARSMHDINVIGTLQLLAACEQTPTIEAVVVRGSAGIYGAEPASPQFYTEEMARLYPLRTRFQRDIGEIENYFEGYSRRRPEVCCTMLRYQPAIGPGTDSQVTRYLSAPVVPTFLGFDPRLQFVHEADGIEALLATIRKPVRGAVNVAAPGTIGLTKMLRMAGKVSVPVPAGGFALSQNVGTRVGMPRISPDFRRLLRYGRAVDVTRLVEEIGYMPRYSASEAIADYVSHQNGRRVIPSIRHLAVGL
ncbi:MAG: UDP-glucose 4-epimerase [Thermoleophilaceae bacterium]|nr:UDP-glucose 4-epimerase [Thermoleophilaceae bacterium]